MGLAARHTTACRTFINVDRTRPILEVYEQVNNKDGTFHVEASRDNNYIDAGAACSDVVDGILTQDVQVSGDVVNMATVGTYLINYDCEDDAGRQAYQAHRTVIVEDTTCPTCSIPGGSDTITIEASFPYSEAQSVCTDNIDGYLGNARKTGSIDVELTGTYILTYSSTDRMNNGRGDKIKGLCKGKTYTSRGWVVNQPEHTTKTVIVEDTMVPIISLSYKKGKLMADWCYRLRHLWRCPSWLRCHSQRGRLHDRSGLRYSANQLPSHRKHYMVGSQSHVLRATSCLL